MAGEDFKRSIQGSRTQEAGALHGSYFGDELQVELQRFRVSYFTNWSHRSERFVGVPQGANG